MPKRIKKRKLSANNLQVAGLEILNGEESLDQCLAELEATTTGGIAVAPPEALASKAAAKSTGLGSTELPAHQSDRIKEWNLNFLQWMKHGIYTPQLLPSLDVELARHYKVQELSSLVLKSGLRMPSFERWLLDSKLEEDVSEARYNDAILTSKVTQEFASSVRLIQEIVEETDLSQVDAAKVVEDLCSKTEIACHELQKEVRRWSTVTPFKNDHLSREDKAEQVALLYQRKKWKKPFCLKITKQHYEKLKTMFFAVHGAVGALEPRNRPKLEQCLDWLVMVLTLRYSSLSGGQLINDLRGGGMQGAVHEQVFDVLTEYFSMLVEGFASPWNAYMPTFGSAFADVDHHFGSAGLFDSFSFEDGACCEANPPFSPAIMNTMVNEILKQLEAADQEERRLTYCVIVPSASEKVAAAAQRFAKPSHDRLTSTPYNRFSMTLPAREHGYIEGAQHMRPTRYKDSNYATSIICLQSRLAREGALDEAGLQSKLRSAFVSKHKDELANRRRNEQERVVQ